MKFYWIIGIIFLGSCNYSAKQQSLNEEKAVEEQKEQPKEVAHTPEETPVKEIVFDYDTSEWTDIGLVEESIIMDLKYATTDNFVKEKMYDCGRCFLRKEAAEKIFLIHQELQEQGFGLKMFDCYRPRPVQWKLWKKVPDPRYVANPEKGSMHNRGAAVDLTIVDKNGEELDMGTAYDFFGPEAHSTNTDLPKEVLENRKMLSSVMKKYGFSPIRTEWWHFSLNGYNYPLSDMLWECGE